MTDHNEEMLELVAIDALGALDPADVAPVRAHAASCAQCQAEYGRAKAASTALALSASEEPPARLRARVMQATSPRASAPNVVPLRRAWAPLLAAAAVVAMLVTGFHYFAQRPSAEQSWIAVCAAPRPDCGVSGRVVASTKRSMMLETHGLGPLPAGKMYQSWVIRPGAKPTPEPMFAVDEKGNGIVLIPVPATKGLTVAVTMEPKIGSNAPTTAPILAAKID
ncbi:MAG: anti-sigma factor [Candidatus Eremiobacteraeota bacterium]|nr:anti-sigma factor [Candidatus Eremiobacteraeota bacterium]